MTDARDPRRGDREHADHAGQDAQELDGVDARVRSLRDAPVDADTMARMRAGLAERIDAATHDAASVPIEAHPRWQRWAGPLAAALAAGLVLFFLSARVPRSAPDLPLPEDVTASNATPIDAPGLSSPPSLEPPSSLSPPAPLEEASDEALAMAVDLELLSDYDVIAQLDLLELLDEMPDVGDPANDTREGRI